jgi:hypothetical protein
VQDRVLITGTVLVAGLSTAAFTTYTAYFSAHALTGRFGAGGEEGRSEEVDMGAPDFPHVAESLIPKDILLPPGDTYAPQLKRFVDAPDRAAHSIMWVDGIVSGYASYAVCRWENEWLIAYRAGSVARLTRATSMLTTTAVMPIWARIDGGGVVDGHHQIAVAAQAGDAAPIVADYSVNCDDSVKVGQ